MTYIFSPKTPSESVLLTFDFSNLLSDINEILVYDSWNISTLTGIDANPTSMLVFPISLADRTTSRLVQGGISGNSYQIIVDVTTSIGQVLQMTSILKIQS